MKWLLVFVYVSSFHGVQTVGSKGYIAEFYSKYYCDQSAELWTTWGDEYSLLAYCIPKEEG